MNVDIHKRTAAAMFGVAYEDVTPEQRAAAKQRNYWHLYFQPPLSPTGRQPSQPEMQDFSKVTGKLGATFTDEQLHAVQAKASQLGHGPVAQMYALAVAGFSNVVIIAGPELDAILAGLALLREAIPGGLKFSYDSVAGQCWTNGGEHDGLGVEAVQELADRLNGKGA